MKVAEARAFGSPEVLEPVGKPVPSPEAGQALIEVSYAPALFLDTQVRAGQAREWLPTTPPYVPGSGVAGTVAQVGEGVDPAWVGREVVADTRGRGGYAEWVVVDADLLVDVPDGVELAQAAALLHDGRTALKLIDVTHPGPGEWLLILSAAGGLGALLVQLGRAVGADVIGAVGAEERKLALVRDLGGVPVDYTTPHWVDHVRELTQGEGVDVILDGIGGSLGSQAFELARPGARFSAHGAPSGGFTRVDADRAAERRVTVTGIEQVQLAPAEGKRLVERALAEAAAGRLRPIIGQTFALSDAADAHRAIESRRVLGKTLLRT